MDLRTATTLVALACLSGCDRPATRPDPAVTASKPPVAAQSGPAAISGKAKERFRRIADTYLLDVQIPFVESIAGPAREVDGVWRTYEVDGCSFRVQAKDGPQGAVNAFSISPKNEADSGCTWKLDQYYWPSTIDPYHIDTEELLEETGDPRFSSDCLNCGNSHDPYVGVHVYTSNVTDNIEYYFTDSLPDGLNEKSVDARYDQPLACQPKFQNVTMSLSSKMKTGGDLVIGKPIQVADEGDCGAS